MFYSSTLILSVSLALGQSNDSSLVPFTKVLYHLDRNVAGSFTYNYGINHLAAIALSFGIIETGIDWKVNRFAVEHPKVSNAGMTAVEVGGVMPILLPLSSYFYGRARHDGRLQTAALAMGQSALIAVGISSAYKAVTGRKPPGIRHGGSSGASDYSGDFKFGFLRRGAFNGWPSSHTMTAFAMATTLSQLYPEKTGLKVAAFTYASLIGAGVSVNIHWFSDAMAGAVMGYAVGRTVAAGYGGRVQPQRALGCTVWPMGASLTYRF